MSNGAEHSWHGHGKSHSGHTVLLLIGRVLSQRVYTVGELFQTDMTGAHGNDSSLTGERAEMFTYKSTLAFLIASRT